MSLGLLLSLHAHTTASVLTCRTAFPCCRNLCSSCQWHRHHVLQVVQRACQLHAAWVCEVCVRLPGMLVSPHVSFGGEDKPAAGADAAWSMLIARLSLSLVSIWTTKHGMQRTALTQLSCRCPSLSSARDSTSLRQSKGVWPQIAHVLAPANPSHGFCGRTCKSTFDQILSKCTRPYSRTA